MKRKYRMPKVKWIDFCYDEQVTASSGGNRSPDGDPDNIGKCQQSSPNSCRVFWVGSSTVCQMDPFSLRK